MAELAVIMEFGAPAANIPARPALRIAFDLFQHKLIAMGKELMPKVILGQMPLDRALGIMGAYLAAKVREVITTGEGVPPENKPATLAAKYPKTRPLVDTGQYANSFTWALDKEK